MLKNAKKVSKQTITKEKTQVQFKETSKQVKVEAIPDPNIAKPNIEETKESVNKNHIANLICFSKYIAIYLKRYEFYSTFGMMRRWRINTLKLRSIVKESSDISQFSIHSIQLNTVRI